MLLVVEVATIGVLGIQLLLVDERGRRRPVCPCDVGAALSADSVPGCAITVDDQYLSVGEHLIEVWGYVAVADAQLILFISFHFSLSQLLVHYSLVKEALIWRFLFGGDRAYDRLSFFDSQI